MLVLVILRKIAIYWGWRANWTLKRLGVELDWRKGEDMLESLLLGLLKILLSYWRNQQTKNDVTVITIIVVKK